MCALPESWVRLDIAICRGLLDGDSFEITLGLAVAETRMRLTGVYDRYGVRVITEMCQAGRWKKTPGGKGSGAGGRRGSSGSSETDAQKDKWVSAKELFLRIAVAYEGFLINEAEIIEQSKEALGLGSEAVSRITQRAGFNFIYGDEEKDFFDNFPAHFLRPSPHVVTCVDVIHEGKSLEGVCYLFQQLCYNFGDILVMWIGRGFEYNNRGDIRKGLKAQDRLYIMWKGEGFMATLTPTVLEALSTNFSPTHPVHKRLPSVPGLDGL